MFSDLFFQSKAALEPIRFHEGEQLVPDELRLEYSQMINFLDYLKIITDYSQELNLPLEQTVTLMFSNDLKRLGWAFESNHLARLMILFNKQME